MSVATRRRVRVRVAGTVQGVGFRPFVHRLAAELGVAGVVACELAVSRGSEWQSLGTLTVYADEPGALDDESAHTLELFAAHLSIVAAFDRDRLVRRSGLLEEQRLSVIVIGHASPFAGSAR